MALLIPKGHQRFRLAAVIARRHRIIGFGINSKKTHPIAIKTRQYQLHAELSAILSCKEDITDCTAYVARVTVGGNPGIAKPCKTCQEQLQNAGIKKVYYTLPGLCLDHTNVEMLIL